MELLVKRKQEQKFDELFETLKKEYSSKKYAVYVFGIGKGRSIIVGKTFSVGVRVYLKPNNLLRNLINVYCPMKLLRIAFIALSLTSCTQTKKSDIVLNADSTAVDSTFTKQIEDQTSDENVTYDDEECVFDTSTYRFTTEALKAYDKNISFHWDTETASALAKLNDTDSLILHIGGCSHFSYSAIFITDSSKFKDHNYLIEKTKWLAESFFSNGFDDKYTDCIDNKQYQLEESTRQDVLYYSIIDQDITVTDHVYEGWTFEKTGPKTKIVLSGYQN
jgi:hypothetical protein